MVDNKCWFRDDFPEALDGLVPSQSSECLKTGKTEEGEKGMLERNAIVSKILQNVSYL